MTLWVATKNAHKIEEISQILGDSIKIKSLLNIEDFPEIEESGSSYLENAEIKARTLWEYLKEPVFADDSGLDVDSLNGEPGIRSARFSGLDTNHSRNIAKLLNALKDVPIEKRSARFRCMIVYIDNQGISHEFSGTLDGYIGFACTGEEGFGYDPIFMLPDRNCSLAQLSLSEKNMLSHRFRAIKKLKDFLII